MATSTAHVLLAGLVIAVTARAQSPESFLPASAPFEASETQIPMRDGPELAADIYLPRDAGAGPWPVVLIQTPYDKNLMRPWFKGEGPVAARDRGSRGAGAPGHHLLRDAPRRYAGDGGRRGADPDLGRRVAHQRHLAPSRSDRPTPVPGSRR